ncbi:MAG: L,D-transpeptidase [Actinobacteria bacterium]|nr:L,D-transpeptidase [Actinomycetota bacterium]
MTAARGARGISRGGLTAVALVMLQGMSAEVPSARAADPFQLSEPGKLSRWAFVERTTVARTHPRHSARAVSRLATMTPERTQSLVLALERVEVQGRLWLRVRLPVLPNGTTGWIPRDHVGSYHAVRTHLIVDTTKLTARLERSGRTVFRARIGVGKPRWPTPHGEFFVRNRLRGFQDTTYGPLAFGTNARSAVLTDWPGGGFIGIHGTNQPGLLPGRVSHGCIRMRNADILRLDRKMPVGTPLTVR